MEKIKITQITHNWGLNLSLISYKSSFKIIPDSHNITYKSLQKILNLRH